MTRLLLDEKGKAFINGLSNVVVYICLAVAILSIVYAVYIAYLFFTASDQNKRKAAKDRLIKTLASCLIIFTAAAILKGLDISFNETGGDYDGTKEPDQPVIQTYHYEGTPEFNFGRTNNTPAGGGGVSFVYFEGSFMICGYNIFDDVTGKSITASGKNIFIKKCNIVNPDGWLKNLNDETADGSITRFNNTNDATFKYTTKFYGGAKYDFPCIGDENNSDNLFIMVEVSFFMYSKEEQPKDVHELIKYTSEIKNVIIKVKFKPKAGENIPYKVSYTM